MFRFAMALLLVCSAPAFPQAGAPGDTSREKDVYAIYSLMLANPRTSHGPDQNNPYVIAAVTGPGHPAEPCVRPPKERQEEFGKVLSDYAQRKATPRQLKRQLSIAKPYVLLTAEESRTFRESREAKPPGALVVEKPYPGATDLYTLTDVYFNHSGTLALTAISSWCGGLCGLFQWKVFEKQASGSWVELDWPTCISIAGLRR